MKIEFDKVIPIMPTEEESKRLAVIRIDATVKITDFGARKIEQNYFSHIQKNLPPQWFTIIKEITIEGLEVMDEYQIGCIVKSAYNDLKQAIKNYEQP